MMELFQSHFPQVGELEEVGRGGVVSGGGIGGEEERVGGGREDDWSWFLVGA
jgi:hypothetical protein